MRGLRVPKLLVPLATAAIVGCLLFSGSIHTQQTPQSAIPPPAGRAARVHITKGPALESIKDGLAIISWTSNNPGGSDEHFGVVHYGTDPKYLGLMAKSHIRLNQNHRYTVFRVRVGGLKCRVSRGC